MVAMSRIAALAGLAALSISAPAAADPGYSHSGRGNDRHGWHDNRRANFAQGNQRRDDRQVYAAGYREGYRANSYRQQQAYRGYGGPSSFGAGHSRQPTASGGNYWYGSNGRINCQRSDGSTGVVVGAIAGGALGSILAQNGNKLVGSIIGGTLGALVGQEVARGNGYCR